MAKQPNYRRRMDCSLAIVGLNAFYWYQISSLDSVIVKAQNLFSSHGGFLTYAMK